MPKTDKEQSKQIRVYLFLRLLVGHLIARILGFRSDKVHIDSTPYLVISNHVTDFDPILLGVAFDRHMYFVAGEHVFRGNAVMRFAGRTFSPISRVKGRTDAFAAKQILSKLKEGANVCLFAEGNTTFNGLTEPVFSSTGRLAQISGATLVTYRLEGGYLAAPRWAKLRRKGPVTGRCVGVYPPEQLRSMSAEAITAAINADIFEDAFQRQAGTGHIYKGKDLAERLELALYQCPRCGRIGTLRSSGDLFACTCGLRVRYSEAGTFESADGAPVPFRNVRDWDAWQTEQMRALAASMPAEPVFSDEGFVLRKISETHDTEESARGTLSISAHELRCGRCGGGRTFPLSEIAGLAIHGAYTLVFTATGGYYELRPEEPRCARKYYTFFHLLKETTNKPSEAASGRKLTV